MLRRARTWCHKPLDLSQGPCPLTPQVVADTRLELADCPEPHTLGRCGAGSQRKPSTPVALAAFRSALADLMQKLSPVAPPALLLLAVDRPCAFGTPGFL